MAILESVTAQNFTMTGEPGEFDSFLEGVKETVSSLGYEILFVTVTYIFSVATRSWKRQAQARGKLGFEPQACSGRPIKHVESNVAPRAKMGPVGALKVGNMYLDTYAEQVISTRLPTSKALCFYRDLRTTGGHLTLAKDLAATGSEHSGTDLFAALIQCAGRAGQPEMLIELLDDMKVVGMTRPLSLYESAMRLLAGKKNFEEAIQVYDRLSADGYTPSNTTLSCLVGFTCELGLSDRAQTVFNQLCEQNAPSVRACMSMLRMLSRQQDWNGSVALLNKMRSLDVPVDTIVLNNVLSVGVAVGEINRVTDMLYEEVDKATRDERSVADVVSYNIVLKGLAQQGKVDTALTLLYSMVERGTMPNLITFNTAIDAAVRSQKSDDVWRLYRLMITDVKLRPDKCTASTLVKSLYQNHSETQERLELVEQLVNEVFGDGSPKLQESLLNGIFEASLRLPSLIIALRTAERIRELGFHLKPADLRQLFVAVGTAGDEVASRKVHKIAGGVCDSFRNVVDKFVAQGHSVSKSAVLADSVTGAAGATSPVDRHVR